MIGLDFTLHAHRRLNALTGEWVLVSPQRTARPWQGQVEAPTPETVARYDPTCYMCPGNTRANGATNPKYERTYAFTSLEEFTGAIGDIMSQPGPVFCTLKVVPEVINEAIGRRPRWQTRTRTQAIADLRKELGAE